MTTCWPSTGPAGIVKLAGTEAMFGWLLVKVRVGPPADVTPLTSICPIEPCPPMTGLPPVILKSPSVGRGSAGAGSGGTMVSQACPVRPLVVVTEPASAQLPVTSMKVACGTYEVATVKPTLLAPRGMVMPPSCGNTPALALMPLMAPTMPWLLMAPGKPCVSAAPTGASVTSVAATRSPLTA